MTEDQNTGDYTDRELLELIRREFGARLEQIETRLGQLELRTNPLPPNYDRRFAVLETDVKEIKRDMRALRDHDWAREKELNDISERVELLETKAA